LSPELLPPPGIYDPSRAFGDFAIRVFAPQIMDTPHWHGHVEINFIKGAALTYDFDGREVIVPDGAAALFWAGVPHRATAITPSSHAAPELTNIYLPLDAFLLMPHIKALQQAVLSGGVARLPTNTLDPSRIALWREDLTKGGEFRAIMQMELNAAFRRANAAPVFLAAPRVSGSDDGPSPANIRHVVAMVRVVMENIGKPMANADVTAVTGLHTNHALALFSKVMRIPLKRFIIRMRLARARALLAESDLPAATIAAQSGFGSLSQFFGAFKAAYGETPNAARKG
jgi:AraC family transcriptional regulator, melibiose operon regulatory protein